MLKWALCLIFLFPTLALAQNESPSNWNIALVDSENQHFNLKDLLGKTLLLNFIFTKCASACPLQTRSLTKVQRLLSEHDKALSNFVSISIDPNLDSPTRLSQFAKQHAVPSKHWRFARPQVAEAIAALTQRLAAKVTRSKTGEIDHRMVVYLIDMNGRIVQRYAGTDLDAQRIASDIATANRLFTKEQHSEK